MDKFNPIAQLVQRIVLLFLVEGPGADGGFLTSFGCLLLLQSLVQVDTILIHYLISMACFDFVSHFWIDYQDCIST